MSPSNQDPFGARSTLSTSGGSVAIHRLRALEQRGIPPIDRLPFSMRVLLENALRHCGQGRVTEADVEGIARGETGREIALYPARIVLQDFTGVPAVADLAAMRGALARLGGDPDRVHPSVPVDLVVDHSVQVDAFGSREAFESNVAIEFERNRERYAFLRWAQGAFRDFRVVPPGTGIVHQVNLEYLASVVARRGEGAAAVAFPDTVLGTDSHTTMVNGLGVLGWGVGGIEAEAVLLGEPYVMLAPEVVGFRFTGELPPGSTATDLVLTVTQILRREGVVGAFVEFHGPGLSKLSLADRATIANMAPEYGATMGFFPVDGETLRYLRGTGRPDDIVDLVERYTKEQGLFWTEGTPDPIYGRTLSLDLSTVEPSLAGPKRPQDRVGLAGVKPSFEKALVDWSARRKPAAASGAAKASATATEEVADGSVVIAAITSCTNTSNPSVLLAAGLLARNAIARGLRPKPWVKTSLAPGSRVVTDYLRETGLLAPLEEAGFFLVGYGCTTCIGNSGPLPDEIAGAIREGDLAVAAVLSGNRNFEGRIHSLVRANYLASPPLVVAYAFAGTVRTDLSQDPLGHDAAGRPVHLRDVWPRPEEVREFLARALDPALYRARYGSVFEGDERWNALEVPKGDLYAWDPASTYIQEPPFFAGIEGDPPGIRDLRGLRVLVFAPDSTTTDHISPAGSIPAESPAGKYLRERGVEPREFNTFGARRGNHEVMARGTFGNVRFRNRLAPGTEGGFTRHLPSGETTTIWDAAERYRKEGVQLLVLAGKEYGTGSSRDWAAKGPSLLGVRAVLAESFERIHRSNLLGMGVLPLEHLPGESAAGLGLTGEEVFDVVGLEKGVRPRGEVEVAARRPNGGEVRFRAIVRLDGPAEIEAFTNGGLLSSVLRKTLRRPL